MTAIIATLALALLIGGAGLAAAISSNRDAEKAAASKR